MDKIQSLKEAEKQRIKDLHSEPYQIIIQPHQYPYQVRLTYSKHRGGKIIELEEILDDAPITSCTWKGRSSTGNGCEWLKHLKSAYQDMKTQDWVSSGLWIEEYYKKH